MRLTADLSWFAVLCFLVDIVFDGPNARRRLSNCNLMSQRTGIALEAVYHRVLKDLAAWFLVDDMKTAGMPPHSQMFLSFPALQQII